MLFTLEAVEAKHGDCLILHYGNLQKPRFIVIDGGPPTIYNNRLKPRLNAIKARWHQDEPMPIQLVMVSHIDRDHVNGILQWTNELVKQSQKPEGVSYDILTLWHNSFDDLIGNDEDGFVSSVVSQVSLSDAGLQFPPGLKVSTETALVLASVNEGRELRDNVAALDIPVNTGFKGTQKFKRLVMAPPSGKVTIPWGGLKLTVIGPQLNRLIELQEDWDKGLEELKKKGKLPEADPAAYLDDSAPNLSSIVVLVELNGKRMLLTGDARGDDILKYLADAGLLKHGKIHVDLLKIPHHGSVNNVAEDFFERVTADHYVISGNGDYGNPDKETLELFSAARGNTECTVWVTNKKSVKYRTLTDPNRLTTFFQSEKDKGKKYQVVYGGDTDFLKVDLLEKVTY